MSLALLTSRDAVLSAIGEFDELGRDRFLAKYGFGPARSYFLDFEGRRYDSKAIAGVAVGLEHPERGPLRPTEFSGGDRTVKEKLEQLGFEVSVSSAGGLPEPATWWVNQGTTFDQERAGGYVWAPQRGEGGRVFAHHAAVVRLRADDVVFHYARGVVRAVGVVREAAREETRPSELPEHQWEADGYLARVEYHDAPTPIALEEIPAEWRNQEAGPFTRHGGVKQGYLFDLSKRFVTHFADEFGSRWPDLAGLTAGLARVSEFDEFLFWGRRFLEWAGFDESERDYKLRIAEPIGRARAVFLEGGAWIGELEAALRHRENNLLPWQVVSRLVEWCREPESSAAEAFGHLWGDGDLGSRGRGFLEELPPEVVSGRGTRAAVFSFFLMGDDPTTNPIYRPTPLEKAYELTGYGQIPEEADEVGVYEHALSFFDRIVDESEARGIQVRDRLDSQGVVWAITKTPADAPPVSEWSPTDHEAFLRYRGELPPVEERSLEQLADSLLLDVEYLHQIERLMREKGQVIFFGPPGTGKTYIARQLALHFAESAERVKLVQFHPSYAYEDFVEGYRPQEVNGQPGFGLVSGPLKDIAESASAAPDDLFVLIIDEVNRGNVPKVFGELYFLLEYRDERMTLQYSSDEFALPSNLWIIGTMNTADRSIALLDAALRRRFYFVPFFPDQAPIAGLLHRWLHKNKPQLEWVAGVVDRANAQLDDRNVGIGPSFFMRTNLSEEWVELIWEHAITPYLAEQFFGEEDRLADFSLERLRFGEPEAPEEPEEADAELPARVDETA